ncbi:MAG: hypothetical protein ACRD50_03560 [Candidatus Acidiferrales bacterium]
MGSRNALVLAALCLPLLCSGNAMGQGLAGVNNKSGKVAGAVPHTASEPSEPNPGGRILIHPKRENPVTGLFSRVVLFVGTHKELLGQQAAYWVTSAMDVHSSLAVERRCPSCRETNHFLPGRPSAPALWSVKAGFGIFHFTIGVLSPKWIAEDKRDNNLDWSDKLLDWSPRLICAEFVGLNIKDYRDNQRVGATPLSRSEICKSGICR